MAPYNILLILKTPRCKKNLENAVNLKIMLKLKSYSEFKYTPVSGITAKAHSGKLETAPSQAQQCCRRPSGPNILFQKDLWVLGKKK